MDFNFKKDKNITTPGKEHFLLLGDARVRDPQYVESTIHKKLKAYKGPNPHQVKAPGLWGTLGLVNSQSIEDWEGTLDASKEGQTEDYDAVVTAQIEILQMQYPHLKEEGQIRERYLNLTGVDLHFPDAFTAREVPMLRLDVMVGPNEGALVFYQSDHPVREDSDTEYILPQPTQNAEGKLDHSLVSRDRLSFHFPALPGHELEAVPGQPGKWRLSDKKADGQFIVKVLTFDRTPPGVAPVTQPKEWLEGTLEQINKGQPDKCKVAVKDREVLRYVPEQDNFVPAEAGSIDPTARTLLLFHGTFVSICKSFEAAYGSEDSLIHQLHAQHNPPGPYTQIVAFNFPTVLSDPQTNARELVALLQNLGVEAFTQPVDVIATSYGALVVRHLAQMTQTTIPIQRAVFIAAAQGVGYFTFADDSIIPKLGLLHTFLAVTQQVPLAFLAALAQLSARWFVDQPGMQAMTPDHPLLLEITGQKPKRAETRYFPVVTLFDESLKKEASTAFLRFLARRNKLAEKTQDILGPHNDWVVGGPEQYRFPAAYVDIPNYDPDNYRAKPIIAFHGKAFHSAAGRQQVFDYLTGRG